jgi:hypothetical protein
MVQNLQAAVRQYLAWQADPQASPILIAGARCEVEPFIRTKARVEKTQPG